MIDTDAFAAWLAKQHDYRGTTLRELLQKARYLARAAEEQREPVIMHSLLDRAATKIRAFAALQPQSVSPELDALCDRYLARARPKRKERAKPARSIPDKHWIAFVRAVEQDESRAARAVEVILATGLRVGDVLRLERSALERARATGAPIELTQKGGATRMLDWSGAEDAWSRLLESWTGRGPLAAWICASGNPDPEGGGCAYKTIWRAIRQIAASVAPDERVHPHRLRRTVGVQALKVTGDIVLVSKLLGHRSIQTTAGYVDEADPAGVAQLQRDIRSRFR